MECFSDLPVILAQRTCLSSLYQFSKCAVESSTKGLLTLILSERCETQNSELGNCFYFKSHRFLRFSVLRRQQLCIFGQILVTLCNN